ncbi:MAG: hypothetical protein V3T17_02935 [Pseudomonadales bacterium]
MYKIKLRWILLVIVLALGSLQWLNEITIADLEARGAFLDSCARLELSGESC